MENFHSRDDHLIEIWYTSFYGESVLKTSWTICKGKIYTWWMIRGFKRCWFFNPIQYLYFRVCSRIGTVGGKKTPFPKICHTYPTTWYSYTLPKEDPKKAWIKWHNHWVLSASAAVFHRKSANFITSKNTDIDYALVYNFQFFKLFLSLAKLF